MNQSDENSEPDTGGRSQRPGRLFGGHERRNYFTST